MSEEEDRVSALEELDAGRQPYAACSDDCAQISSISGLARGFMRSRREGTGDSPTTGDG